MVTATPRPLHPTDGTIHRRHRRALVFVRPLGGSALVVGAAILLSYSVGFRAGYRPWPGAPGTAPMTAVVFMLLGMALLHHRVLRTSRLEVALAGAALLIAFLRLPEITFGFSLLPWTVVRPTAAEPASTFGWNSGLGLALCALTILARRRVHESVVDFLILLTLAVPLVALVGYSYDLHDFHGESSIYTVAILLVLASAVTLSSTRYGMIRMLLSPFVAGRIGRLQMAGAFIIPYVVGGMLLYAEAENATAVIGIGVVSTAAFTIIFMSLSLRALDRMDHERRRAERAAYFDATHDHLTGLANRRMFTVFVEMELTRIVRHGGMACIIMIDIDHFKAINDRFGHETGDHVLQRTARLIAKNARGNDLPARLGGEEFAIFLPNTSMAEALNMAERLRAIIASTDFVDLLCPGKTVTVSAGVVQQYPEPRGFDALLRAADMALYTAKANGRNRVEAAETPIAAD